MRGGPALAAAALVTAVGCIWTILATPPAKAGQSGGAVTDLAVVNAYALQIPGGQTSRTAVGAEIQLYGQLQNTGPDIASGVRLIIKFDPSMRVTRVVSPEVCEFQDRAAQGFAFNRMVCLASQPIPSGRIFQAGINIVPSGAGTFTWVVKAKPGADQTDPATMNNKRAVTLVVDP